MADLNELNTHAEGPSEDQDYIDKMVAKADGNALPPETQEVEEEQTEETPEDSSDNQEETPDWLPDKFKSPEELAKAYSELEKKLGGKSEETEEVPQEPTAELDYDSMAKEYWDEGGLSEKRYSELEAQGIPKKLVDGYLAGQQAILNSVQTQVFNEVGGEAQYQEMMTWAQDNLTTQEVAIFDQSVNTNDLDQTLYAVKGLHARYASENGVEPRLIQGDATPSSSGAYASAAEVKRDMADPRYSKDPAFRKKVENKLSKSNVF